MFVKFDNRYSILITKPGGQLLYRLIDFKSEKVIDQGFGVKTLDKLRKKKIELETEETDIGTLKEIKAYPLWA